MDRQYRQIVRIAAARVQHCVSPLVTRALRRWIRDERGEYLIEFAFSTIIFFALMLGSIEIGLAVHRYNMLADLAQEGARRATVCGRQTYLSTSGSTAECNLQYYVSTRSPFPVTVTTDLAPGATYGGGTVYVTVTTTARVLDFLIPNGPLTLTSTARTTVVR